MTLGFRIKKKHTQDFFELPLWARHCAWYFYTHYFFIQSPKPVSVAYAQRQSICISLSFILFTLINQPVYNKQPESNKPTEKILYFLIKLN